MLSRTPPSFESQGQCNLHAPPEMDGYLVSIARNGRLHPPGHILYVFKMSKIYFCPNFDEICNVGVSQEELVALVWRHQEFLPLEEPMSSLPRETLRLHQKQGRPSWRRTQQHVLMFWSLTSAPSSLSGLLQTSSTRWNFLWTSWCNPLQLLLCLPFFDMKTYCASVKYIFSDVYH